MTSFEKLSALLDSIGVTSFDLALIAVSLLLILFSRTLLGFFYHGSRDDEVFQLRVRIIRALTLFILVFYSFNFLFPEQDQTLITRFLYVVAAFYLGYLSQHIVQYFIFLRYGKKREIEGEVKHIETYNTRFLSLIASLIILIVVLISTVHILGMDSLLEAGGAIGVFGVFLALTHAVWAPDLFSGLIILNSNMLEEGDVIELDGMPGTTAMVYKTRMFHTELLNIVNNHRIMLKNARLRDAAIHNLSKFASARGLREKLVFKIGYDVKESDIRDMFETAYKAAEERGDIAIEFKYPLEIGVVDTGDFAVEWAIYYYIKEVRSLIKTRMALREVILKTSKEAGISLATPSLHSLEADTHRHKNPA